MSTIKAGNIVYRKYRKMIVYNIKCSMEGMKCYDAGFSFLKYWIIKDYMENISFEIWGEAHMMRTKCMNASDERVMRKMY